MRLLQSTGDQYGEQNLKWSFKAIHNSLGLTLATSLEKYADIISTGPALYFQMMQTIQSTTMSDLRTVEDELTAMRLRKEPGENVNTFTTTMEAKIRRLEGAGRLPDDIGQIMATGLMNCTVETFRVKFTQVFNDLELNPRKYDYHDIIRMAVSSYRTAIDRKMWVPNKKDQKVDTLPKAFKAEIGQFIHQALSNQKGGGSTTQSMFKGTCHNCNQVGHMARNCPHPKKDSSNPAASNNPSNNNGGASEKKMRWYRIKSKDNESHEQTRNDKKYFWCDKCSRWNTTHKTAACVVGFKKNK